MRRIALSLALVFLAASSSLAWDEVPQPWQGGTGCSSPHTIAALPTSPEEGTVCEITNGSVAAGNCSTTGTDRVMCFYNGTAWKALLMFNTDGTLGIGQLTPDNPGKVEIAETITTATAGTNHTLRIDTVHNPSGTSSRIITAASGLTTVQDGNVQALTTAVINGGQFIAVHRGDGLLGTLTGNTAQASLGPTSGAAADTATATNARGMNILFSANTTSGTTVNAAAASVEASNMGTGTITTLKGLHIAVGQELAGGTVTNMFGVRIGATDFTGTDLMDAGTVGALTFLHIDDPGAGTDPTFSTDPIQLQLDDNTISGGIAIYQKGSTGYNKFRADSVVGADAAPVASATFEVAGTTGAFVVPRLDSTQRGAISSPIDGDVIFNTTTDQYECYNGGWGTCTEGLKCITIESPSDADNFLFFRTERAITLLGIDCLANDGTSVVLTLQECDSNGGSCGTSEAATCATTNTTETSGIDDTAVDAGDWMRMDVGTVTDTTQVAFCVRYQ